MTFEVQCGAASFGVVHVPVPLPAKSQGKKLEFEVGASVDYPEGKGKMLRFRDALPIRYNTKFRSGLGTALFVAGAMGGALVLSPPASLKIRLPSGVADQLPQGARPRTEVLWSLGDDPLTDPLRQAAGPG